MSDDDLARETLRCRRHETWAHALCWVAFWLMLAVFFGASG